MVSASEFKSEDAAGFDSLVGQGERSFFLSLRVNSSGYLFVPDPPHPLFVCTGRTQVCAQVKDPIFIIMS